jgi:hypothetical protein
MNLKLYVVQNKIGNYFRAKGYGGYGETWVSDIQKARIYNRIGPARATITWFANTYPNYGIPNLCEIVVQSINILTDEVPRVKKAMIKKKKEEYEHKMKLIKWDMDRYKIQSQEAEKQYEQALMRYEATNTIDESFPNCF